MRIAYLLGSVSRKAGGLFDACRGLAKAISKTGEVHVLGIKDEFTKQDIGAWAPLKPEMFQPVVSGNFGFATHYLAHLRSSAPDIAHIHALWIYPSLAGYRWHGETKGPLIYTAHGMLDPWALRHAGWKKRLVRRLWENAAHRSAKAFHAISEGEYQSMRKFGLRNPICVIPNGIDLPQGDQTSNVRGQKLNHGRKTLLYLGRLHPKKNLVALLQAWRSATRSVANNPWHLVIAGWDQRGYQRKLERLKEDLEITDSVDFVGPKFGDEKEAAYRDADAFVLPSLSEGLPMVILEAWAYGKPVLMTKECNLPEGFFAGAAIEIGVTAELIANGLQQLQQMSESDRRAMGAKGKELVAEKFSWPRIGEQMRAVYEWVLGGGPPPETVRLN